ncbi:universal stress protein [Halosolutus amylolyticus]|uniref:Universal stress protein n=1 Tax=Halosolutus amylolyticus TaxID=2932267 RepID=A0ABD5PTI3_9EURY|nr:universal stress protein [Halosolutus amylolyticus]
MDQPAETPTRDLLAHVLVPVAHEADARVTARALEPYDPDRVTALHVVEKGEGVPDKTPVEQSEELAADAFAAVREVFPDADDHVAYGRNVAKSIFAAADEVDASAIAYRAREGGRLARFLSGDLTLKLVTQADRPVVALPQTDGGED